MNDTPTNKENKAIEETSQIGRQENPKTGRNIKKIVYPAIVVVLLPLLAFGAKKYNDMKDKEHQENLDFAVLCEENYNIADYQLFLEKYPESQHFAEVDNRLKVLQTLAMGWESIKDSKRAEDFTNFKQQHDDEYYTRLCDLKLDSIDWSSAQLTNTPDAYQSYIAQHPNGTYVSEAIIAKGEVGYMSLTENERAYIHNACNQFFKALGVNNADSIHDVLAMNLEDILHFHCPTPNDVSQWLHEQQEKGGALKSYIIADSIKSQRAFSSTMGISYVSNFPVEEISTDAQGAETKDTLVANVKQNRQFKIYSLTLKHL